MCKGINDTSQPPLSSSPTGPKREDKIRETMNRYRCNNAFVDITLGSSIKAHKSFLASLSHYFEMLFINPINKDKNVFHFPNIEDATLKVIIEYLYTGEINVDKNNAELVLMASREMGIQELVEYSQMIAYRQLERIKRNSREKLKTKSFKKLFLFGGLTWHRTSDYHIAETEVYDLDEASLKDTIDLGGKNVEKLNRYGHGCVLIGDKVFAVGGQFNNLILNDCEVLDLSDEKKGWMGVDGYFKLNSKRIELAQVNDRVLVIGAGSEEVTNTLARRLVYDIDFEKVKLSPMKALPITLYCPSSTVVGNSVYLIGDCIDNNDGQRWIKRKNGLEEGCPLYHFDFRTNNWISLKSANERKFESCFVSINEDLYAIGGGSPHSCEVYDIRNNQWRPIAASISASYYSKAINLEGSIHKFGHGFFNEMYSPITNEWIRTEKISVPRYGFGVIAI
uniref:BTB domain-containing protein n=1 Tax=Rhabditophanes sp. KR3021 TaxID=114890 RepID=A0AC35TQU0_9BILA